MAKEVTLTVWDGDGQQHTLQVVAGTLLRVALLEAGLSPYGRWTQQINCSGRGLCALCGVRFASAAPTPTHWHDRAAAAYGYPRLSCQIPVDDGMMVQLVPDKQLWGQLLPSAPDNASTT